MIGDRFFCNEHHQRALTVVEADWTRSGLGETLLSLLFVFLIGSLFGHLHYSAIPTTFGAGVPLALVPALIWFAYIYRQDRLEPEPLKMVLGVAALGGLLAYAVAMPIATRVFEVDVWRHGSFVSNTVASVLVIGTLQQLCVYLAVRFTVYDSAEFDEPIDGVVYCTAASLGLAVVLNTAYILTHDDLLPYAGATTITSSTLVHVASAAVLGYAFGRARFERPGAASLWLASGFVASVAVNGGFHEIVFTAGARGATFSPAVSLLTAGLLVSALLIAMNQLITELRREVLLGDAPEQEVEARGLELPESES